MLPNPQVTANLVTFTEGIPNGKLIFVCSDTLREKILSQMFDRKPALRKCEVFHKPIFDQCSTYGQARQLAFTSQMFQKHLWKSDILLKMFFKHFASKNQLPGFCISRTLVENGLRISSVNATKSAANCVVQIHL